MKVIGLTGGIGSGKSMVTKILAEMGAAVIDADKIGHEAFKPHTELWQEVVSTFGKQVLNTEGSIDREKLGKIVFNDTESLARLNQIMHPQMYKLVEDKISSYRKQGMGVVVLEAPLLIEAGWTPLVDEVWVVLASEPVVLKRLKKRGGLSEQQSLARIRSQLSSEKRLRHADVVINNDDNLNHLRSKMKELWNKLQAAEAE